MPAIKSIERQCEQCGKSFFASRHAVRRGQGTCCSHSCAAKKWRGRTLAERFWEKVEKTDSCWIWHGSFNSYGYGVIWTGKRKTMAHRSAWEFVHGPVPDGLCVLHDCPDGDNRACVRIDHLWLGTKGQNNKDRAAKGRNRDQRGEKNSQAILTADKVQLIRLRYANGEATQRQLAREHGVHFAAISDIIRRVNWKHV